MAYFPMMINIENKNVLVVGGNKEGLKKIQVLKEFGAIVTLVAKEAFHESIALADIYHKKEFEITDVDQSKFELIVVATNDEELDKRIYELATERAIPVNVVDNVEYCSFIFPAIIKKKDVVCAVSSSGKSPLVAKYLKKLIKSVLPDNIAGINEQMGEYRSIIKKDIVDIAKRKALLKEKFDDLIRQ